MSKLLLTCCLLALPGAAQAAACGGQAGPPAGVSGLYRGQVGKLPITLQVGQDSAYFYDSRGQNISLTATHQGHTLLLLEEGWSEKTSSAVPSACFTLTQAGGTLKGQWARVDGKTTLPVTLNRVDLARLPLKFPGTPGLLKLRRDDPLSFLKLNHAWITQPGGRSVKEPLSALSYFRLPGESTALNGALQDRQLQHVMGSLDCRANSLQDRETEYVVDVESLFTTPKLISFLESISYDCGGAHPDDFQEGVILDRLTGQAVPLQTIWYSLDNAGQDKLYQARLPKSLDAECRDVLTTRAMPTYTANLSKSGVALTPTDLPHVVAACNESVTIPYAALKDQADMSSPYYGQFYR